VVLVFVALFALLVGRESLMEKLDRLVEIIADDRERIVGTLVRIIDSGAELRKALENRAGYAYLEEMLEKSTPRIPISHRARLSA
jgi:hypothetical protein